MTPGERDAREVLASLHPANPDVPRRPWQLLEQIEMTTAGGRATHHLPRLGDHRRGIPQQDRIDQPARMGDAHRLDQGEPFRVHARAGAKIAPDDGLAARHHRQLHADRIGTAPAIEEDLHTARHIPGARSATDQSPIRQRTSRKVGWPIAAVILRTCRFRPSRMTSFSQQSGTLAR